MNFKDKVVLVTGGTKGIGKAIVKMFCNLGVKSIIVFYSRDDLAAENLRKEIHTELDIVKVSITDSVRVNEILNGCYKKHKSIDILVNNAGIEVSKLLMAFPIEEWNNVLNTNLIGAVNICKSVMRRMISSKQGRIINISSLSSFIANPGQTAYAASKAGLNAFTRTFALEMAPFNVTVNAIAPGFIETAMTADLKEKHQASIPLKRFGTVDEVAHLVSFLASDKASYITGQVYRIDGGLSLK